MNINIKIFIKNFSYTLISNLTSMFVMVLVILIVPKILGVEDYGFFQLFLFYSTYVGFMHFGWNDGIYLRYGGKYYTNLDKKLFYSQFYMLAMFQLIILLIVLLITSTFIETPMRLFIFNMTAVSMVIVNLRYMLTFILQATNRIKEYAKITLIEKILFCIIILSLVFLGFEKVEFFIISDLIGKFISLILAMFYCRDIVFQKVSNFYFNFKEALENIAAGIKLMFSNVASNLIVGIVRFGIERSWDIATFGKVSLTLSVSSLLMLFINALSIILFPVLRRVNEMEYPSIYRYFREILMLILLGSLILYYPFKSMLIIWLPNYLEALIYMAFLFPMFLYQGKMALLVNTFFNTLRKEKITLIINLITVGLSIILTIYSTVYLKKLDLAVFSILIVLAFRSILAEVILAKLLKISIFKEVLLEICMTVIFITVSWFIDSWFGVLIYSISFFGYILFKKRDLIFALKYVEKILIK